MALHPRPLFPLVLLTLALSAATGNEAPRSPAFLPDQLSTPDALTDITLLSGDVPPPSSLTPTTDADTESGQPGDAPADALPDKLVAAAEQLISRHGQYGAAVRRFRLAAILGHSGAAATLAALHLAADGHVTRDLRGAVAALRRAALAGQPDALALLGFLHASGLADRHGIPKAQPQALLYWTMAAGAGNVFANAALGFRYLHGLDVRKNCHRAASYYRKAAHAIATDPRYWPTAHNFQFGDPPLASSLVSVGRTRLTEGMFAAPPAPNPDDLDLFYYHRHLADTGDADSMTLLGSLLLTGGLGMGADHGQARHHLRRAADIGNGEAHGLMGHLALRDGNYSGAIHHFRYSAGKEDRIGHYALGMIFRYGLAGLDKDMSKAAMHFEIAASRKHARASFELGMIYYRGDGREKSIDKAYQHFRDAAKLGNIQSKLNLGMILLDGLAPATEKSCPKAVQLFKEVAEDGEWNTLFDLALSAFDRKDTFGSLYRHAQAAHAGIELGQYNAAMILEMSKDGDIPELAHWTRERTIKEMQELYDMSGRQGNSKSYLRSGDVAYLESKDYTTALQSYKNSADLKHAEGMFSVGMMYANGEGVQPDRKKALDFFLLITNANDSGPAIAAYLAIFGLKTYWWFVDMWEWWAKLADATEEAAAENVKQGNTEMGASTTANVADGSSRVSSSSTKQVQAGSAIGDDLALVGGLLLILIAVLVVRSKRLARQSIDGEPVPS